MPAPQASVLIPFRDAGRTLAEALDSVRNQTLKQLEILLVNDCSNDNSVTIAAHHADRDPRIRLSHSPTPGLVPALNHGLEQAGSTLIARMDADDLMHPERLSLQVDFMQKNPQVTVLATRVDAFSEQPLRAGMREYLRWQNGCLSERQIAEDIYLESPFAHPSVMLRREPVLAAGGYADGPFPEDYELWLRLHHRGERLAKLPQVLLQWRDHPNRASRVHPNYSTAAFDMLRARYLAADPRLARGDRDLVFWGAGRRTRKRVQPLLQLGFRPAAWIDIDPRKIGNRIGRVPVVAPEWLLGRCKPLVLNYVARHGARELIERQLGAYGYEKGLDYLQIG